MAYKETIEKPSFWDWIKLNLIQAFSFLPNVQGVRASVAENIMRVTQPDLPPTVGEMASSAIVNLGKVTLSVLKPLLWVLGIILALFILWAFIGRK